MSALFSAAEIPWGSARPTSTEPHGTEHTDARWAERFAARHAGVLRYDHHRNHWFFYSPPLWRIDTDGEVIRLALAFVRDEQTRTLTEIDDVKARARAIKDAI